MYLVLGKRLANDHDRAIRYTEKSRAQDASKEFSTQLTLADWCDRCNCYHVFDKKPLLVKN